MNNEENSLNCDSGCENCGCEHDHEHDHGTIMLNIDGDRDVECSILGIFDVDEKEYIAFLTVEDNEIIIYTYAEDEDGNMDLGLIETDEEFEKVEKVFYELFEDEDDLEDDDEIEEIDVLEIDEEE